MERIPDAKADIVSLVPDAPLSRRGFVVTSLATGFAAAAGPVMAETMIKTDTAGLDAREVKIPAAGGDMPAYAAAPAQGGPFPIVLVVHEAFGVHEHIKDVARRLAKQGYLAVAPDLFARFGDATKYTMAEVQKLVSDIVSKVTPAQMMADLDAALSWAEKNQGDAARVAITGFCFGGSVVWLYAAHQPRLKAAVAWYGGLMRQGWPRQPMDAAREAKMPVLGLYGGKDQGIPMDQVDMLRDELKKAGSKSVIHVYPDAGHAFNADYRPTYREADANDGWKRMMDWFKANGVS